ncbi:Mycothiol S-conjugate amidase [compost metagenome]
MKRIFLLLSILCSRYATAQQFRPQPSSAIFQELQQLQRLGTVMYIAAHPDDENTRLIAYLVHHDHINTIYLSLTRGDGGQNILGNEQGAALGLIRTNEMMRARQLDGAGQLFTQFVDFGFSKSPDETFSFWNREEVVNSVKQAIQQYRPDVLICRFPTTGEGGHGQHTASAIAAKLAFEELQASTDPNVWKPRRLLFNAFKFGTSNTIREGQFLLPINQYDPLLGESYGELAGRSRSEHKSQGAGTPQTYGIANENFEVLGGAPMSKSLYDGVDTSWNRVGAPQIGKQIAAVINRFDFAHPEKSVDALLKIRKQVAAVNGKNAFWSKTKLEELDRIILHCAGIQAEALAAKPTVSSGDSLPVTVNVTSRMNGVQLAAVYYRDQHNCIPAATAIGNDSVRTLLFSFPVTAQVPLTEPFWMQQEPKEHKYIYPAPYKNEALNIPHFVLSLQINIGAEVFTLPVPISYKQLNPTRGDVIEPVRVMPVADLEPLQPMLVAEPQKDLQTSVRITLRQPIDQATLLVYQGKDVVARKALSALAKDSRSVVDITIPAAALKQGPVLKYVLQAGNQQYDKTLHLIQYDHIPALQYFEPAQSVLMQKIWVAPKVQKIGYIAGAGDKVAEALSLSGFDVSMLSDADLSHPAGLAKYDVIVCGVRVANVRKDLARYMPGLWQYVAQGGRVVMQYNTSMGLELPEFSPLPLSLSRDRITDEQAAVNFINPADPLLQYPNVITSKDFDNWVQERGIYYPSKWDKAYVPVLSMQDPGEQPLNSAILYAPYGKGWFVYTGLAFFRQLPAGNVGAMRLFVNLLHVGMKP